MGDTGTSTTLADVRVAEPVGGLTKRCLDLLIASAALLVLSPLLLLLAAAVRLSDGGPALYKHKRLGVGGARFDCMKFRSMVVDADAVLERHLAEDAEAAREWAETQKLKNDPRVTAVGRVLRKTSLDELPQLINVLRGEMSIVGPRPIVEKEVARYGHRIRHYYSARPGLTGAWQISGRNDISYDSRVELDTAYVEGWSLTKDVTIIVMTIPAVLASRGCY